MTSPTAVRSILKKLKGSVLKLDIVTGETKEDGFISISTKKFLGADIVHGLEKYPWPIPENTFTLVSAPHVVHRINPANEGFIKFMNEIWRVTKVGGQLRIATPFAGSTGYWSDPGSVNGCTAQTWHYFDPEQGTGLYRKYRPKPWKIEQLYWQTDGLMEVLLSKRADNKKYKKI